MKTKGSGLESVQILLDMMHNPPELRAISHFLCHFSIYLGNSRTGKSIKQSPICLLGAPVLSFIKRNPGVFDLSVFYNIYVLNSKIKDTNLSNCGCGPKVLSPVSL